MALAAHPAAAHGCVEPCVELCVEPRSPLGHGLLSWATFKAREACRPVERHGKMCLTGVGLCHRLDKWMHQLTCAASLVQGRGAGVDTGLICRQQAAGGLGLAGAAWLRQQPYQLLPSLYVCTHLVPTITHVNQSDLHALVACTTACTTARCASQPSSMHEARPADGRRDDQPQASAA